jgi:hypothetical protein
MGVAQVLLSGPQKIVIDAKRNRLLVSNDNTGSIVAIDSVGEQSFFAENAGFIDGMEIVGDTVYGVANNRKIRAYDLVSGQFLYEVPFGGISGNYLSSIAYDSAGCLFISCPKLNEIYRMRISDHSFWIFAKNNGLNKPNGILLERDKNRITVIDDSPNSTVIHGINLSDSTDIDSLALAPFNSPDGITRDMYGNYYVTGYYLNKMYRFSPDFSSGPVPVHSGTSMVYPTYDARDNSILVTHYNSSTWERIPLSFTELNQNPIGNAAMLLPVYPNPINTGTIINFELTKTSKVQLDVIDTNGLLINRLVDEIKQPGKHSVKWDCKTSGNVPVNAGVVYFRLNANGNLQTQKAIVTK